MSRTLLICSAKAYTIKKVNRTKIRQLDGDVDRIRRWTVRLRRQKGEGMCYNSSETIGSDLRSSSWPKRKIDLSICHSSSLFRSIAIWSNDLHYVSKRFLELDTIHALTLTRIFVNHGQSGVNKFVQLSIDWFRVYNISSKICEKIRMSNATKKTVCRRDIALEKKTRTHIEEKNVRTEKVALQKTDRHKHTRVRITRLLCVVALIWERRTRGRARRSFDATRFAGWSSPCRRSWFVRPTVPMRTTSLVRTLDSTWSRSSRSIDLHAWTNSLSRRCSTRNNPVPLHCPTD